jgi:tetratricopeptide (TPR) repeat protein
MDGSQAKAGLAWRDSPKRQSPVGRSLGTLGRTWLLLAAMALALPGLVQAADLKAAAELYHIGRYEECIQTTQEAIAAGAWDESWWLLRIESELALGRYREALASLASGLKEFRSSLRLRLLGHEVHRRAGQREAAAAVLKEIPHLASQYPWRYSDAANRVALGRAALLSGADARTVLELFYDRAAHEEPDSPEPCLAAGELALDKHDYALAAEQFTAAERRDANDPRAQLGLARAYAASDPLRSSLALAAALKRNPRSVEGLLLEADRLFDSEQYAAAEAVLQRIQDVNPYESRSWAYRAAIAHLHGDTRAEELYRSAAARWADDAAVEHLIGRKLSENYRFAAGAAYQQRALQIEPSFLPARLQLAQDLLRMGDEAQGWQLVREVADADGYNVVAYNLTTLHEHLSAFRTIADDDFVIRMEAREAEIYGRRVQRLLHDAKAALCAKYQVQLTDPIVVEIFPEQKDFAVRTFGLPGGAGYLGVCFGKVITANSPASQGDGPTNWEAVLWHEFCHVVTLTKTRNKMPRWLSEGISVYEERQRQRRWGQSMTPRSKQMILRGELTPVSELSGAFLKPPTPAHLQFAYYQSSLVVEYLIERYGFITLLRILTDLADDVPINHALARHTGSLAEFEDHFAAYARRLADAFAPQADWNQPEFSPQAPIADVEAYLAKHPGNIPARHVLARRLLEEGRLDDASAVLQHCQKLYPEDADPDGSWGLLAEVYRRQQDVNRERGALEQLVTLQASAAGAHLRLAELAAARQDWPEVLQQAQSALAINPLVPAPHRRLAEAAAALGNTGEAIAAHQALLQMDPLDPAELHFRLAQLWHQEGHLPRARLAALRSLEEAPRYRAAQRLLLTILREMDSPALPLEAPSTDDP